MIDHWEFPLPDYGDAKQAARWLKQQLSLCKEDGFATRFATAIPVPGMVESDYLHRVIEDGSDSLLTGIRFKGGDARFPFVDLLAWKGNPKPGWMSLIGSRYKGFNPRWVRFAWSSGSGAPWPGEVDQFVYAGKPAKGDDHPCVRIASDLNWYEEFCRKFEEWANSSPIGNEVCAATREQLQQCLDEGHVAVATESGNFLGVAATCKDSQRAFSGWTIIEEFVTRESQGNGLGQALQRELMRQLCEDEIVWGTIHGTNIPSQKTAEKCRRKVVETWWFHPLPGSS